MNLKKMKIDKFKRFSVHNFPEKYSPKLESVDKNIDVVLYYINSVNDVLKFVELCKSADLADENRVIMVYEKGRKDGVNRDTIFMPFKQGKYPGFIMKAPMLCSISEKLSAFVQQRIEY